MTPDQKSALEAVVGRALSADEHAAIEALLTERNDVAIAGVLSTGRVKIHSSPIGIGTVLAVMAPSGGDFLNALEATGAANANVRWALKMIEQGTLDVGHPVTRAQLDAFAKEQPLLTDAIKALLSVAEQPDPIHYNAVSDVLNIADGRLTMGD